MVAAKAFFAQWLQLEGTSSAQVKLTCADAWNEYWHGHVAQKTDLPKSQKNAAYCWQNLDAGFADMRVCDITQRHVNEYTNRRASGSIGRPSGASTVRHELTLLRAAINYCARAKMIPADDVPYFTLPAQAEPRDTWLSGDEINAMLEKALERRTRRPRNPGTLSRLERYLHLAANTGARKSAILDLTWDRVDFDIGVIHFAAPGRRVTKKRRVSVPISDALMPVLRQAYAERKNNLVMTSASDIYERVVEVAREVGLEGVSPHTFRHSAATHMARSGVPMWTIAKILGSTAVVIEKTYAKHAPEFLRDAVNRVRP